MMDVLDDPMDLYETGGFIQGTPIRDPRTGIKHRIMAPAGRYDFRWMWTYCSVKINIVDATQRVYDLPSTQCLVCPV